MTGVVLVVPGTMVEVSGQKVVKVVRVPFSVLVQTVTPVVIGTSEQTCLEQDVTVTTVVLSAVTTVTEGGGGCGFLVPVNGQKVVKVVTVPSSVLVTTVTPVVIGISEQVLLEQDVTVKTVVFSAVTTAVEVEEKMDDSEDEEKLDVSEDEEELEYWEAEATAAKATKTIDLTETITKVSVCVGVFV